MDSAPCPSCTNLAGQVNALTEVIRGVVYAARPHTPADEKERAWKAAGAVLAIADRRADPEFQARLADVKERHG